MYFGWFVLLPPSKKPKDFEYYVIDTERHSDATSEVSQVQTVAALENHLRQGDENISCEQEHLQAETIARLEEHLEIHENNKNYGKNIVTVNNFFLIKTVLILRIHLLFYRCGQREYSD